MTQRAADRNVVLYNFARDIFACKAQYIIKAVTCSTRDCVLEQCSIALHEAMLMQSGAIEGILEVAGGSELVEEKRDRPFPVMCHVNMLVSFLIASRCNAYDGIAGRWTTILGRPDTPFEVSKCRYDTTMGKMRRQDHKAWCLSTTPNISE
jgi:hypothetical protein